jgi:hypothetical protein
MSTCSFVRRVGSGYEYGTMRVTDSGTKKEARTYHPAGQAPSYEEALAANNMALAGLDNNGKKYVDFRPLYN